MVELFTDVEERRHGRYFGFYRMEGAELRSAVAFVGEQTLMIIKENFVCVLRIRVGVCGLRFVLLTGNYVTASFS